MAYAQRRVSDGTARYVIVEAAYEADATQTERSLRALAPELADAGLTMIDACALDRKPGNNLLSVTQYGELTCHAYTWDSMESERNGSSPVVWMRLRVSGGVRAAAS